MTEKTKSNLEILAAIAAAIIIPVCLGLIAWGSLHTRVDATESTTHAHSGRITALERSESRRDGDIAWIKDTLKEIRDEVKSDARHRQSVTR